MTNGRSTRSGSASAPPSAERAVGVSEAPAGAPSLPAGYYEHHGIRGAVQRKAAGPAVPRGVLQRYGIAVRATRNDDAALHEAAARGTSGTGGALPHLDPIQRSFGRHDVSHVRAHTGRAATEAARAMGAEAYATGDQVAFAGAPSLHTAAHEAAHVIQQRGGVHLAGGVGREGDPHERHADAVADAVVAGRSSEALLDAYAGGAGGGGGVQRRMLQLERHVGATSQASVAILQQLASSDDAAGMRALVRALDETINGSGDDTIHVRCVVHGDQYDLVLTNHDATTMRQQLADRAQQLGDAASATSMGGADTTAVSRDAFADGFNHEFADILPALRQADRRAVSGGATEYTAEELRYLFSATQRQKLQDYFNTRFIPDRLFNGDDVGNANAQQRILISSHILANGRIRRGSFTQRLHARFCGHWVELVNNYAGVGATGGRGIENELDHDGDVTMGSGHLDPVYDGAHQAVGDPSDGVAGHTHREFRRAPLPVSQYGTIQPGDWLYVFTNTDTAGGDHSVIFANWLDDGVQTGTGADGQPVQFRLAAVFSQTNPDRGGARDEWHLGERATHVGGHPVYPITHVERHDADDRPPTSPDEVAADDLGVSASRSGRIERQNDQYIHRHEPRGQQVNREQLNRFLREQNQGLLAQLQSTGHAEPGQIELWRETDQSESLEVLVRLNERLNNLCLGVESEDRAEAAETARVEPRREAAQAHADEERTHLQDELHHLDEDIGRYEQAEHVGDAAQPLVQRRRDLLAESQRIGRRLAHAPRDQRAALRARRRAIDQERAQLATQIQQIQARRDAAVDEARQQEGPWRVGGSGVQHQRRLEQHRAQLEQQIQALDEAGGYQLAQPGRDFRSQETMARVTGLLENARPQPAWRDLLEPAPASATAPRRRRRPH